MKKPMLFWIASALPTSSGGQARAESAENCGESATTTTPQTQHRGEQHARRRALRQGKDEAHRARHRERRGGNARAAHTRGSAVRRGCSRARPRRSTANDHADTTSGAACPPAREHGREQERHERPERVELPHVAEIAERGGAKSGNAGTT